MQSGVRLICIVLGLAFFVQHFICEIHCNAFSLLIFLKGNEIKYRVNIGLEGNVVSVTVLLILPLHCENSIDNIQMNEHGCALINLYLQK